MLKRIEKLTIKDFRGATLPLQLDFDKSKPMVMIFGESGTGKSSIVDAFDFICNQKYGSIENRSSIRKKTHLPAIGKTKGDIAVSLKFAGKEWKAHHIGNEPKTEPDGFPVANILRRSNILKLIDAPPSERYKTLSQFLSVPSIEKCENTLRSAVRNQEQEYDESIRSVEQAKDELEKLQQELSEGGKPAEEWAKEVTEINEEELEKIVKNAEEIQMLQKKYTMVKDALGEARIRLNEYSEKEKKAVAELKKIQEKKASKEELQKLLNKAKDYFANNVDIDICPVCGQSIHGRDILNRLIQRLSDMATLTKHIDDAEAAIEKRKSAEETVKTREGDYKKCETELILKINASQNKEVAENESELDYDKLISELSDIDNKDIENTREKLKKYNKYKAFLKAQKSLLGSIKEKEAKSKKDSAILRRLKKYGEIIPAVRKKYVDDILITVSSEVERLYQAIHPEEGLGGIRLYLKPNVQGSLEFSCVFQDFTDIPPQAYYSDAHLDTLGICMFLALAKYFNDNNTIIVLDDVVTSADEAHRERFLNILHDEADKFCHMIVTTHYRPWRDFYRIGGGPANKVQFIDLQLWSKGAGIRDYKSGTIMEELKKLKESITIENRQNIASKSGILLEGILDQLALRYELKVPRKVLQRFELGILFNSLSKHKKHLKTIQQDDDGTETKLEIKPLIENLENMIFIRNQIGSHWNMDGSLLSDTQVKEFAEHTITLCEALTCSICGNLPSSNKSGCYWQCQCGKMRLYPLQMP